MLHSLLTTSRSRLKNTTSYIHRHQTTSIAFGNASYPGLGKVKHHFLHYFTFKPTYETKSSHNVVYHKDGMVNITEAMREFLLCSTYLRVSVLNYVSFFTFIFWQQPLCSAIDPRKHTNVYTHTNCIKQ